jgi:X-X-X-Leu-X-X-Gly heptad repeat protein
LPRGGFESKSGTSSQTAEPNGYAVIRIVLAPIRRLLSSPLLHFAIVVVLIVAMEAAPNDTLLGKLSDGLDKLVDSTAQIVSAAVTLKTITKSLILTAIAMAYVYVCLIAVLYVLRAAMRGLVNLAARTNFLWLRTMIARERGIAAYRAWLPLETIRPNHIPQQEWEAMYAWPPGDRPPYPPLAVRAGRAAILYASLFAGLVLAFYVYRWMRS